MKDFWTTFFYIIIMIAIIVAAYLATKYLSKKGRGHKSSQIQIVDRVMLGKEKHIVLIEVGGKNLLIGVTNQAINVLGDIDSEALNSKTSETKEQKQKGLTSQLKDIIINLKDAPANYNKAREQAIKTKKSNKSVQDDYLSRMDEAMQKRKGRIDDTDKEIR